MLLPIHYDQIVRAFFAIADMGTMIDRLAGLQSRAINSQFPSQTTALFVLTLCDGKVLIGTKWMLRSI